MANIRNPPKGKQLQQLKGLLEAQTGRKRTGAQLAVKTATQKRKTQRQRAQKAVSKQNITDVVQKLVQQKVADAVQQQVKDVVPKAVKQQTQQTVADAVQQQVNDVVPKAVQQKTQQQLKDIVALPQSFQSSVKRMIQQINTQQAQLIRKVVRDLANGKPVNKREILPKFHPDRVKGKQQAFKLLNNILSNPDQFKKYTRGMLRILDSAQKGKQPQAGFDQFAAMRSPKNIQDLNKAQRQAATQAGFDQFAAMRSQKNIQDLNKAQRQAATQAGFDQFAAMRSQKNTQVLNEAQKQAARKKICDKLKQQRVLK